MRISVELAPACLGGNGEMSVMHVSSLVRNRLEKKCTHTHVTRGTNLRRVRRCTHNTVCPCVCVRGGLNAWRGDAVGWGFNESRHLRQSKKNEWRSGETNTVRTANGGAERRRRQCGRRLCETLFIGIPQFRGQEYSYRHAVRRNDRLYGEIGGPVKRSRLRLGVASSESIREQLQAILVAMQRA